MSDDRQPPTCGGQAMEYDVLTRQWQCDCGRDVAAEAAESAVDMRSFDHCDAAYFNDLIGRMSKTLMLAFEDDIIARFAQLSHPERCPAIARRRARRASQRPLGQCRGDWFQLRRRERRQIVMDRYHQRVKVERVKVGDGSIASPVATNITWREWKTDPKEPRRMIEIGPLKNLP